MSQQKVVFCFILFILIQFQFCYCAEVANNKSISIAGLKTEINKAIERNEKLLSESSLKKKEIDGLINERDALIEEQIRFQSENEGMDREIDDLKAMIKEIIISVAQEKEFAKLLLKEQPILKAKLKKIEMLWDYATRLYNQQKYKEAISAFEGIIKLEGEKKNEKRK